MPWLAGAKVWRELNREALVEQLWKLLNLLWLLEDLKNICKPSKKPGLTPQSNCDSFIFKKFQKKTHPNKEQWKYVSLEPTPFGGGTPVSAEVPCDFLYASYLSTKHSRRPGITISPRPSIEKWPLFWILGKTNFPGKFNFGGSLTIPPKFNFLATIPTGFSAGLVATFTITFVLKM